MPWFPVDDGFAFHRKAVRAGNAALGLWVRAGSWSAQQTTDGFVPDDMVAVLGTSAQADRLVKAGLWTRVEDGFEFHEWSAPGRNKTRAQIEEMRASATAKKARQRAPKETQAKSYTRTADGVPFRYLNDSPNSEDLFSVEPQVEEGSPLGTQPPVPRGLPGGHKPPHPIPSHPTKEQTPSSPPAPDAFDEFWAVYPKKASKAGARKKFSAALKSASAETIIAGARRYAAERAADPRPDAAQWIKHPTTWLHNGCWDDAPERALRVVGGYQPFQSPTDHSVYHEDF